MQSKDCFEDQIEAGEVLVPFSIPGDIAATLGHGHRAEKLEYSATTPLSG